MYLKFLQISLEFSLDMKRCKLDVICDQSIFQDIKDAVPCGKDQSFSIRIFILDLDKCFDHSLDFRGQTSFHCFIGFAVLFGFVVNSEKTFMVVLDEGEADCI